MKTRVILMMSILMMSINLCAKDRYHLNIGGEFLGEKNVKFEVYQVHEGNKTEKYLSDKTKKTFDIMVEVGGIYLIKFYSKSGFVKNLYIRVDAPGIFLVNIDFTQKQSAKIKYSDQQRSYVVETVPEDTFLCYNK